VQTPGSLSRTHLRAPVAIPLVFGTLLQARFRGQRAEEQVNDSPPYITETGNESVAIVRSMKLQGAWLHD